MPRLFACSVSPRSSLVSAAEAPDAPLLKFVKEARSLPRRATLSERSSASSEVNPNPVRISPVLESNSFAVESARPKLFARSLATESAALPEAAKTASNFVETSSAEDANPINLTAAAAAAAPTRAIPAAACFAARPTLPARFLLISLASFRAFAAALFHAAAVASLAFRTTSMILAIGGGPLSGSFAGLCYVNPVVFPYPLDALEEVLNCLCPLRRECPGP